jgi:Kdo2-lipid IVA lauroyltransferase/acyltransferase
MRSDPQRLAAKAARRKWFHRRITAVTHPIIGRIFVLLVKVMRLVDRRHGAALAAAVMRAVGPWRKEHRVARDNLIAAFPRMSAAQIETILSGVWDNLGRVGAEFVHLDRLRILPPGRPGASDILYDPRTAELFEWLRLDNKPGLIFSAHLANWELPSYVAAIFKLDAHILYRRPNVGQVDKAVREIRAGTMGTLLPARFDAPVRLLRVLEAGGHVGMLVDQHFGRGVNVTFFGRRCKANPLLARLAAQMECPIHGVRVVRLPQLDRFRVELTEELEPARGADGKIDVAATMQIITSVIEGWVREHPEQWLWVHKRWR